MNPPPPTPEQYQRIALYSFLASAPLLMVNGSTELWEALGIKTAQAQVNYTGPSGWTNKQTQKQKVRDTVTDCLRVSMTEIELENSLKSKGLELYKRGMTWGVEFTETGRRYRMKTLGLDKMLEETQTGFKMLQERTQELEQVRKGRKKREERKR